MAELMIYKLHGTLNQDNAASLDILVDGMISAALLVVALNGADALNDGAAVEVSFASTSGFNANDTRASIIGSRSYQEFLTTGGSVVGTHTTLNFGSDGIPVSAGERLYLHISAQGTVTHFATCWLYVRVTGAGIPSRRRL